MNKCLIRVATEDDFDSMASVQRRAVDVTLREHYDTSAIDEWLNAINVEKFHRVALSGAVSLVATVDDEVVGFSSYTVSERHIGMWYVDPAHHGMGIGRQLLEATEEGLKNAGVKTVSTEASLYAEPRFERLGWHTVETFDKPAFGSSFQVSLMVKNLD